MKRKEPVYTVEVTFLQLCLLQDLVELEMKRELNEKRLEFLKALFITITSKYQGSLES